MLFPPRNPTTEQEPCPARGRHARPQAMVQASPAQAATQRLAPVGASSQPGSWWLTSSLEQQLHEPLDISTLTHDRRLLFYGVPEQGLARGSSLAPRFLTRRFQRRGFWGGLSAPAPQALPCGDSAPWEAARLGATSQARAPRLVWLV